MSKTVVVHPMSQVRLECVGCNLRSIYFKIILQLPVHFNTTEFFNNCYDEKFIASNAKTALTDAPSNTWCRAPGTVEGIAMIENIMEHIAKKVNKDPLDVRMNNIPADSEMKKLMPEFVKSVGKITDLLPSLCAPQVTFSIY